MISVIVLIVIVREKVEVVKKNKRSCEGIALCFELSYNR